jgi:diguanylate cyclase (GGDEF)-like protein/PAS domain S-box-containing protein
MLKRKIGKVKEDLQEQHEWFRVALSSIGDGVIATDVKGDITFINPVAQKLVGMDENEAAGKHINEIFKIVNEESGQPVEIPVEKVIREGSVVGLANHTALISKDGTEYLISDSAAPIRNDNGEIMGVVMVFQDVTERKKTEYLQTLVYKISDASSKASNLDDLFAYIHNVLGTVINTHNFYICLCDKEKQTLIFPYYIDSADLNPDNDIRIPRKHRKGLTEYVIKTGESLLINDKGIEELIANGEVELIGILPIIWLGVPLKAKDRIIGVMTVQSYSESVTYTQKDLEFMEYISNQIALVIERKRTEETINHMAYYDVLTDLPNRVLYNDRLSNALSNARCRQELLAVLFIDLDRFKNVNDSLGHALGDKLLQSVSKRLSGCLRECDTIARVGGDEFTILLPMLNHVEDAAKISQRLLDIMETPFYCDGYEFNITTSIGISIYPYDGEDVENLLKNSDTALYRAKERGRNNYQLYNPSMNASSLKLMSLENDLRKALERDEFIIHYQPQINIETGMITGMEALLRWNHPELGIIFPADFISLAEETGLIIQIDEWVLRNACRQNKAWQEMGYAPLKLAVNISSRQFQQHKLCSLVEGILHETGLNSRFLELELTESMVMHNAYYALSVLNKLKHMGINIALDDFGTGYSSFGYLKRFPVDTLKIDKTFIRDVAADDNNGVITTAIIALAHSMKRNVVAEGVETHEELEFLKKHGCNKIQGNLIGSPVSSKEFEALLKAPYVNI